MRRGDKRVVLGATDVGILDALRANCVRAVAEQRPLLMDPSLCASVVAALNPIFVKSRRRR